MKIAMTESFLDDILKLQHGLQRKCHDMLSSLKKIEIKNIRNQSLPGWRLHKLQTSPFISLSLDMNYRVLAKIDGDTLYLHRAVKHSLADEPRINRKEYAETPYELENSELHPSDIFDALISLGLPPEYAAPFKGIETEDNLLEILSTVEHELALYALALYETSGLIISRSKYTLLQKDKDFESALKKSQSEWDIYIHPSQSFIVNMPVDYRIAISGSAGTGKTVCAWYRLQNLAKQGHIIGFVAPNKPILQVSQRMIEKLLKGINTDCYYLVPSTDLSLLQLVKEVKHIIIDEGQEITPNWYKKLGSALKTNDLGITIFYDLNQLGGSYSTGDTRRYEYRLSDWNNGLHSISKCHHMDFYINYRNSREIAQYYTQILEESLPQPIKSEIPVFSCGDVNNHKIQNINQLPVFIADIIRKLQSDYTYGEIGIIFLHTTGNKCIKTFNEDLQKFNIPTTLELETSNRVLITAPRTIRGHEKKALIICCSSHDMMNKDLGKAINSYIAFSRARDRLFVVEIKGG
ncbi:MAG TPA: hypothetical protein PLL26_06555 [Candidatus Dojkabacteria bacterium]|nr:hypothetical protein [Candidatus Dojkabacteria bacterium]